MASGTIYQRQREAFFNSNNSPTTPAPSARTTSQAPDTKSHMNGDSHTGNVKDFARPQSPNGVASNYAVSNVSKKYNANNVRELHGTVGFANIPNQVFRKAVKQGFEFSLMVVGQSGLGKSTFVNSLFLTDFYNSKVTQNRKMPINGKTLQINESAVRLVENGVGLTLTLVDTPGFGDAVDNSQCWDPIIQYVDRKFSDYFTEETKIYRKDRIPDNRVHCCLYFIPPTGHGLRQLDIEFMKHLHDRVNIIPVIAKADTMTPEECAAFKKTIAREITDNKIKTYVFPDIDDGEETKENQQFKGRVPFAVIGSNMVCDIGNGKKARCRKYPWGTVEVDNLEHNDFIALRNMLIRTHIIDLIDVTRFVHYENFRCRQLISATNGDKGSAPLTKNPFTQMEEQRREFEEHVKQEEIKRELIFQEKLVEKQERLKIMEKDVDRHIEQMRVSSEQKKLQMDSKRSHFVQERLSFKQMYPDYQKEYQKYFSSTSLSEKEKVKKKRSVF